MPDVSLRPLADEDRDAFVVEQLANYADQQVRDAGWPPGEALAMLATLEEQLARDRVDELPLNVVVGNEPARRLYAGAGYEQVGEEGSRCRSRKRLGP